MTRTGGNRGWAAHALSGAGRATGFALAAAIMCLLFMATAVAQGQGYSVLYTFTGGADGDHPDSALIADSTGNLYGTTEAGGDLSGICSTIQGCGVVFEAEPAGNETVLHTFTGGVDGAAPLGALLRNSAGALFGTAEEGGNLSGVCAPLGCGVAFRLEPDGNEIVLHAFTGGSDGAAPVGNLFRDSTNNLYGATFKGGMYSGVCSQVGCGVVFKLDQTGNETVLYSFTGGTDGAFPTGGLIQDSAGNLYGTTLEGGSSGDSCGGSGCGVVFKLDSAGNETVLYSFTGQADGGSPTGGLVIDAAGNLYGTASEGGSFGGSCGEVGCGVVFQVDSAGAETVLYAFSGGNDGSGPSAALVRDPAGNLYGVTAYGGSHGYGVVFKLSPAGTESLLHRFSGGSDGAYPATALLLYKDHLYGTTFDGGLDGLDGYGLVFELGPQ
jgi:uncharacterized repeat protein (TIGR03803 family)